MNTSRLAILGTISGYSVQVKITCACATATSPRHWSIVYTQYQLKIDEGTAIPFIHTLYGCGLKSGHSQPNNFPTYSSPPLLTKVSERTRYPVLRFFSDFFPMGPQKRGNVLGILFGDSAPHSDK